MIKYMHFMPTEDMTSKHYKRRSDLQPSVIEQKGRITDDDLEAAKIRSEAVFEYFIKTGKLPITR